MGNVENVGAVGNQLKGRREAQEFFCCQVLEENNQFKSFQTKEQSRIRQDINCKVKMLSS